MPWLKCDQQVATPLGGIGQTAQLQGTLVLVAQNVKGSAGAGFAFGDRSVQGGATTQHTLRAQRHGFGHITAVAMVPTSMKAEPAMVKRKNFVAA